MNYYIRNKLWRDHLLKITPEISGLNVEKLDKKLQILQTVWTVFVGDKNITELFEYKYDELYNSVSYEKEEFLTLQ